MEHACKLGHVLRLGWGKVRRSLGCLLVGVITGSIGCAFIGSGPSVIFSW